jgi:hypothetical protein
MKSKDIQLGKPNILYTNTKDNIEALSNPIEGMEAFASDINLPGYYTGSVWVWSGGGGGSGSSTFIDLIDTPETYIGNAGKMVVVNAGATALEFVTVSGSGGSTDILMVQVFS